MNGRGFENVFSTQNINFAGLQPLVFGGREMTGNYIKVIILFISQNNL